MKNRHWIVLLFALLVSTLLACNSPKNNSSQPEVVRSSNNVVSTAPESHTRPSKSLDKLEKAYFASGCFWCVEAIFESVKGVEEAVSGYAGGAEANPTYREVSSGNTGHTEAVEVYYDPEVIEFKTLVKVYYGSHDPTTVNGQHPDYGTQYRSMILYTNDEEKQIAEAYKNELEASGQYSKPIVTEIKPLTRFWKAEDYHQDYERNNPRNSYIQNISIPRLNRFKKKYPELLKEDH